MRPACCREAQAVVIDNGVYNADMGDGVAEEVAAAVSGCILIMIKK